MTDLAALAIAVDSRDVATGVNKLDELTAAGGRAETAVEGVGGASQKAGRDTATLAQQAERLLAQLDPLYAAEKKYADALILADKALQKNIFSLEEYNKVATTAHDQMTREITRLTNAANDAGKATGVTAGGIDKTAGASKLASHHLQNLTFQINDVVVGLMSGQKPMTVFMQQGTQIGQIMGQAGVGIGGMVKQVAGLAGSFLLAHPALLAVGAAAGVAAAAIGFITAEINKNSDVQVTWKDVVLGAWDAAKDYLSGALTQAFGAFGVTTNQVWDSIVKGAKWAVNLMIGVFTLVPRNIITAFQVLPAAFGDVFYSGVNLAIKAINFLVEKAVNAVNSFANLVNPILSKLGLSIPTLVTPKIAELENAYAGAAKKAGSAFVKNITDTVSRDFIGEGAAFLKPYAVARAKKRMEEEGKKAGKSAANGIANGLKDESDKSAQAMADGISEAYGNVWKLAQDIAKRQQDWGKELADAMAEVEKMQKDNSRIGMSAYDRSVAELDDKIAAQRKALEQAGEDAIAVQAVLDKMRETGMAGIIQNKNIEGNKNALDDYMRTLDAVSERVDATAQSMRDAFGSVGGAIGDVITVLDEYGKRQAEIDEQRKNPDLTAAQAAKLRKKELDNQISGMVSLTGAAKGMFKEHSKGYQAMAAAEKVLSAIQLARTAVDVAGGAARMFATLGPFAFPAVAAMLGIMASLGFSGGGKSGKSFDVKEYQDAMGTGSVLGDSSAKSDSIASSLDLLTANSDKDLEYSNAMVRSLRAIETNIGSLSSLLAKQLGIAGGAFETSGLGLGSNTGIDGSLGFGFILKGALDIASKIPVIGGLIGGIGKALFGTKTTKTLLDQGIMFDPATVADILAGGIDGQTYQDIQTKKKKKTFGITTSNKTRVDTVTGALDDGTEQQVALLIGSMRSGIMAAAGVLGIEGAQAAIGAFTVDLGKISLKDMKGSEIQEQLSAIFSKLGDDMAAAAIPALDAFQKVGEGQFETLMRLAKDYQTIDVQMQSIGRTFGAVGASSVEAREALIDLFGSLDDFVDQTQFYRDNFLTEAEQIAPVMTAVAADLERLGLSGVDSIASFKAVVDGIDLTTDAGRELYAAMMALAPGFNAVEQYQEQQAQAAADLAKTRTSMEVTLLEAMGKTAEATALKRQAELAAMDESLRPLQMQIYAYQDLADAQAAAAQKVSDARDALSAAYSRESSSLQSTADKFRDFAKSIGEFRASLFTDVPGVDSYALARSRFDKTANLARLGNEASLSAFTGDAQSYLDAARDRAGSALDYARDVARVAAAADQAQAGANGVASMAERQLNQLTASVKSLIDLNDNVTTVWQAIADLEKAQAEEAEAQAGMDKLTNPVPQLQEVNVNLTDINGIIERLNDTQSGTKEQIAALRAEMQSALIAIASNTGESARIARRHDRGDTQAVTVEAA